ncbi:MAG TPA: helix-turn-helix domain-containing protein [Longimicrobiales bacterium]|nr:helix-turn-helix domain-containing protein [Longimicrobiales bacterium]
MGVLERKEREFMRREREILDAALALFSTEDWQAVTVEQIAERAEIGKGTVYKHFASKDEIYARLACDFQRQAIEKLERIDRSLPVLQRLRLIIAIFWEQHLSGTEYQHLVQYCERDDFRKTLPVEAQSEMTQLDSRFEAAIDRVLQDGIDQGILPAKPRESLIFGPIAALNGATRMACNCVPQEAEPGQYLNELTNFILAGMLYQEWLAEEGLDSESATRRALEEMREVEAELARDAVAGE